MAFWVTLSRWLKGTGSVELDTLEAAFDELNVSYPAMIELGETCMMTVMDRHFLVRVVDIDDETVRVTFPGIDYPIQGMLVDLEFHDPDGFRKFESKVVQGPEKEGDGVVLARPSEQFESIHRDSFRIDTELSGRIREAENGKSHPMTVYNISTLGALVESPGCFTVGGVLRMAVEIPRLSVQEIDVEVVHAAAAPARGRKLYQYGVTFVDHEPGAGRTLTEYIWSRLRQIYKYE